VKKVVCARCELVNLDTFPAFPFCEACGARLPSLPRFGWRGPLRRPILPLVCAVVLGGSVSLLAFVSVGLAHDPNEREGGALIAFGQGMRDPQNPRARLWTFVIRPADPNDSQPIRNLSLRLPSQDAQLWRVSVVSPPSNHVEKRGKGRYFAWNNLGKPTVQLRVVPPTSGPSGRAARLPLWWSVEGYEPLPVEIRASGSTLSWKPVRESFTLRP